jgi:hypothetical protein
MKDKSFILRSIGALLVVAMLGVACSEAENNTAGDATTSDSSNSTEGTDDDMAVGSTEAAAVALDEGAPALVQTLTDLLDSHVYLASIAVSTGLNSGLDSPEFKAAATTLDTNSQDLAAAIGSVYGAEAGDAFLKLWRKHIGFFVDYTAGKATKDDAKADKALKALEQYKKDFSEFLDKATGGELPADDAAGALQMHVDSLITAIDSAIAGDPKVFDDIYEAATGHMPMTASALAGAITAQFPEKF